jgi:hypothetical protein
MGILQTLFDYSPIGMLYNFITTSISSLITDLKNGAIDMLTSWYAIIIYICVFLYGVFRIWSWRSQLAAEAAKKIQEEKEAEAEDEAEESNGDNQSPGMDFAAAEAILLNKIKQEQTAKELENAKKMINEQNEKLLQSEANTKKINAQLAKINKFLSTTFSAKKRH